ncbi:phosphoribosyltransferase [Zoogloea sp.]|uniref:phosphoribosyltransferase n=1 Tax=Zoogloea sp. TaxID=49181 RepID=UPI001416B3A1|nr:MAG: phosphoribosyltransferase [Zoogloea sp.]
MLMILTGTDAVAPNGVPRNDVVDALKNLKTAGNVVAVVSNHAQPNWFEVAFFQSEVQFLQVPGRQNGKIITENAARLKLHSHDTFVLAATDADMQMGKNGSAILIAANWSTDARIRKLGVNVSSGAEFYEVLQLSTGWQGTWWFASNLHTATYSVRALADLSSMYGQNATQQEFASKLKTTIKGGGPQLTALLAVTARSLLSEGVGSQKELLWSVYPSSRSTNDDTDVLSDFCHRLRVITSRARYAQRECPLFIRHAPSAKRSQGGGGDRTNPTQQIETIHLNPFYKKSLTGRHVIVLDDCTTYGVSFGVAAGLLRKAGAKSVTGVALGKFGNCLSHYQIDIQGDPFKPIRKGSYSYHPPLPFHGATSEAAKTTLRQLIR